MDPRLIAAREFVPELEDWGVFSGGFFWGPTFPELLVLLSALGTDVGDASPSDIDERASSFSWVGTLEELLTGPRPFETGLRRRFREGGASPISEGEYDGFVEWLRSVDGG